MNLPIVRVRDRRTAGVFTGGSAIASLDMPLEYAAYVPAVGQRAAFIAAVRGPFLFALDPVTGAKVGQLRFSKTAIGRSAVVYNPFNDRIYTTYWLEFTPGSAYSVAPPPPPFRFMAQIDPATLTVESQVNITVNTKVASSVEAPGNGAMDMLVGTDGTIYGGYQNVYFNGPVGLWRYNPLGATPSPAGFDFSNDCAAMQVAQDPVTHNIWCTYSSGPALVNYNPGTNDGSGHWGPGFPAAAFRSASAFAYFARVGGPFFGNVPCHIPTGLAYDGARQIMWVSGRPSVVDLVGGNGTYDATLHSVLIPVPTGIVPDSNNNIEDPSNVNGGASLSGIVDLGTPSDCFRCRYNNGLVYCPVMADDSIVIVNAATNTVSATKTGFEAPFDIVFTDSKAFAVQLGQAGLKEIV